MADTTTEPSAWADVRPQRVQKHRPLAARESDPPSSPTSTLTPPSQIAEALARVSVAAGATIQMDVSVEGLLRLADLIVRGSAAEPVAVYVTVAHVLSNFDNPKPETGWMEPQWLDGTAGMMVPSAEPIWALPSL